MPRNAMPESPIAAPLPDPEGNSGGVASVTLARISHDVQQLGARIAQGSSIDDLRCAASQMDELVAALHRDGLGIGLTTGLARAFNDRLLQRLWSLLAPGELVANSCLIVMGSEARGEQTLRTDQDNGLLLRDGFALDGLAELAASFTAALLELGYPLCPGGIMLSSPRWRQHQAQFRDAIRAWCYDSDPDGAMQLAIVLDARAIAGDAALLDDAKAHLWAIRPDSDAFLARFASPVGQFDHIGGGWWHWLAPRHDGHEQVVDLKKSGSFQIVHGVRTLALKHQVAAVSTAGRLHELVERHGLPVALARDLRGALGVLIGLRFDHHLRQRQLGQALDNIVHFRDLGTLEHAALDSVMAIVKEFRRYLAVQCPFDML